MTLLIIYLVSVVLGWFLARFMVKEHLENVYIGLKGFQFGDAIIILCFWFLPVVNTIMGISYLIVYINKEQILQKLLMKITNVKDPRKES